MDIFTQNVWLICFVGLMAVLLKCIKVESVVEDNLVQVNVTCGYRFYLSIIVSSVGFVFFNDCCVMISEDFSFWSLRTSFDTT